MVYASIKEAWGINEFCKEPPENPYVVQDPIQNTANFKKFRKNNFANKKTNRVVKHSDSEDTSYDSSNKYYKDIDSEEQVINTKNSNRVKKWCSPKYKQRYFLDKEDEYSDQSSNDTIEQRISKKIKLSSRHRAKPIITEAFENQHQHKLDGCSSILEHLKHCKICRGEMDDYSKNIFIKEFIIFAGSGIIIFLFLDLLRKIAQKSA
jgi:hypothetical protein